MTKSLLFARSNLRKAKGQTSAIFALILIASLMLNLWLMLSMDYKQNFDRYHDKLNAEHVTMMLESDDKDMQKFIAQTLEQNEHVTQYCITDAFSMAGSFQYNDGEVNNEFIILEQQTALNRTVGQIEIVEEGDCKSGVYLPMLYGTDPSHAIGNSIDITIGNTVISYTICGYLNSVMTGSHNCSLTVLAFTPDQYEKLEKTGAAIRSSLVSARIDDKTKSEEFEADLKNTVSSKYPDVLALSNSYALVSSSRYISQMICSGIVSAMAFFVTLIAVAVIISNVINYIQENMKDLGVQKAVGYKSGQIIFSLLLQFLGLTILSSMIGIALSYCLFPTINAMMILQTGIPYAITFLPLPCIITIAFINGIIALFVWLSSRRIKKIEPITALRQGVLTHNFKNNHIPLEKTRLSLHAALALKTTFSNMKQNFTICITMMLLSLVVVFSGLMMENVIVNMEPFVNLIVGETADAGININAEIENEFIKLIKQDKRVEKIYLYHGAEVRHVGGLALSATLSQDFSALNNQNVCIEGRFPKYDNEMAIAAKYAKENNLKIGDEITLTAEGNEANYIISGFTQISNNLGKDCLITQSGYERMGQLSNATYYLNIADHVDIDQFNEEISQIFEKEINATLNISSLINGTGMVYVTLMTIIVIAILILSALIITFVLYLLVRTMLNNKKQEYGIMKALGFTTKQLILQTAISFMPAIAISTTVGLIINAFIINPLTALFLNGLGIVKCTFAIPVKFISLTGVGLILFAFFIACLMSIKIKKISPIALLTED